MFLEQVRVSREMFENLREQMILQVSSAIKPLVTFLRHHDCDEDEILAAIFEAIAYEKDAEPELGMLAADKFQDWSQQTDEAVASRFSQAMYRIGMDLFRDFQNHRLYQHGFLPYQYNRMHGQDVLVDRLGVPDILHREQKNWEDGLVWKMRGKDGSTVYFPAEHVKPRGNLINPDFHQPLFTFPKPKGPSFEVHQPIAHRVAGLYEIGQAPTPVRTAPVQEYLCGFARAFKNFHTRQAEADAKKPDSRVTIRHADGRVEHNVDESAIEAWEKEIQQMFAGLYKTDPQVRETVEKSAALEESGLRGWQSQPNGDWRPLTQDELKQFSAEMDNPKPDPGAEEL